MKDKMRCASCGAMFKPSKSSQTKCERCEKREREQRAAARHADVGGQKTATIAPVPVRISGPAAGMIGGSATPSDAPAAPPESSGYGMAAWREEERRAKERQLHEVRERERVERDQQRARERGEFADRGERAGQSGAHQQPFGPGQSGQHAHPGKARPPHGNRSTQTPKQPRTPKAPKAAPPKIELTDDLRATIEARYLELAQPIEFDGIRTRIATDLSVPKALVKKAVSDLRGRMSLPSWWDLQAFTGAETDLERIRIAYVPLLPVPEVGVHKTLATKLSMDPRAVYQGIRRIRAEMRLPQYNSPDAHGDTPVATPEKPDPTAMPPAMDARD